jgi:O-antigen/teichoic acid export membrane protein
VALIGSLTSVLLLFPRALSFNALPALARVVHRGSDEVRATLAELRRNLVRLNTALSLLALVAWGGLAWWGQRPDFALSGATAIFLLYLASFYVGQLVLPEANYLQTVEETRLPLRVNVLSLVIFVAACGLVMLVAPPGVDAVLCLFAVLLGATLSRNLLLRRAVLRRAPEVFA